MPEIGEVARIVHYLRKHLTNKRIASVQVQDDNIVYGKVGTTAEAFKAAMTGKTVLDARQQGKYFWLVMSESPHPVMHLGMTGWIKFSRDDTSSYRKKGTVEVEPEPWPPKFWKFILKTEEDAEIAFVDARRLARIRLVDAAGEDLRKSSPLKENGPDPVIDKDILTLSWLTTKLASKKVPVKALLLDQANISGVGNWVADELLYQARIHPEQRSNELSTAQVAELFKSLMHVCDIATGTLADSDQFPETWLMKYRWDKGKKDSNVLPNGDKIIHLKVGGRTSAIVPRVQKKSGGKVEEDGDAEVEEEEAKPKRGKAKRKVKDEESEEEDIKEEVEEKPAKKRQSREQKVEVEEEVKPKVEKKTVKTKKAAKVEPSTGSRRSGRLSGQGAE